MMLIESTVVGLIALYLWFVLSQSDLFGRPRDFVLDRLPERFSDWALTMILCPWCLGFWLAGGVAGLGTYLGEFNSPLWIVWLAGAAVTGWLGNAMDRG